MLPDEKTLRSDILQLPDEPLAARILIPGWRQATVVRGGFGWFSSGWIGKLAPGLAAYLSNPSAETITFTVSPALFAHEIDTLTDAVTMSDEDAVARVLEVFVSGKPTASALARHALDALAWMLATGKLELLIAKPAPGHGYHPKMWWFGDADGNAVMVRGSANATSKGLQASAEHMDVDVSWDEPNGRYTKSVAILDNFQFGRSNAIAKVFPLPEAVRLGIIETAPESAPTIEEYRIAAAADGNPAWASEDHARFSLSADIPRLAIPGYLNWRTAPYEHQGAAVAAWEGGEQPERGVLSMATGAGKTIAALIAATRAQERRDGHPLLIVVSAPNRILVDQWVNEVAKFGVSATAVVDDANRSKLTDALRRLRKGGTHVLVVTNALVSKQAFSTTIEEAARNRGATAMLIGDEAHTLGSQGFITNPPEFYDLRLGLSATPERQYDPDGTEDLMTYFGGSVYNFGLAEAIGFCLVEYDYFVHTSTLDADELALYIEVSTQISRLSHIDGAEERVKQLLIQRRGIIEVAVSKQSLLRRVLEHRGPPDLHHVLIYTSSKNEAQFNGVRDTLSDLDIVTRTVTQFETGTAQLDRDIAAFRAGDVQVLLAKKVLDEGFNLPEVREAFILASSTVEREWVQRRGRVLRQADNKDFAVVHDFLVTPPTRTLRDQGPGARKLVVSELDRALAFAEHARNANGQSGALSTINAIRGAVWPSAGERPTLLREPGDMNIAPGTPTWELP